jgi:hypothetical protein
MKTTRRGWIGRLVALLALAAWMTQAARAEEVTIAPSLDNTLFEDASGSLSDGAGPTLFTGNNGQGLARRALLQFDVAAAVPAVMQILSASLTIYVSNAATTTPRLFELHRVLAAWGEGTSSTTSGSGAPATAGDATWLHAFWPDQLWGTPGGDFTPAATDSLEIAGVGSYACSGGGLASDLQAWLDDPAGNHGWLLIGDEETLNTAKRFDSRENDIAAQRPSLRIQLQRSSGSRERTSSHGNLSRAVPPEPGRRLDGAVVLGGPAFAGAPGRGRRGRTPSGHAARSECGTRSSRAEMGSTRSRRRERWGGSVSLPAGDRWRAGRRHPSRVSRRVTISAGSAARMAGKSAGRSGRYLDMTLSAPRSDEVIDVRWPQPGGARFLRLFPSGPTILAETP